jgi:hypothetical protein
MLLRNQKGISHKNGRGNTSGNTSIHITVVQFSLCGLSVHILYRSFVTVSQSSGITHFPFTIATNCQMLQERKLGKMCQMSDQSFLSVNKWLRLELAYENIVPLSTQCAVDFKR